MGTGDGNGWVACRCGHRHWGRFGAAGLLLVRPDGSANGTDVLLQLRAGWTHLGGTWGLPGGASDSHESPVEAALREAWEETQVRPEHVEVLTTAVTTDHVDWTYTVVVAAPRRPVSPLAANAESAEVRWVHRDAVRGLPLHPGFADGWSVLAGLVDDVARRVVPADDRGQDVDEPR